MDAVTGAALASAVAWASIAVARFVPLERAFGSAGLRVVAAGSLALVGLALLGAPLTAAASWAVLAIIAAVVVIREKTRRDARGGDEPAT